MVDPQKSETVLRKTSLMQRFVNALFSNNEENNRGSSAEEAPVSESKAGKSIERTGRGKLNACFIGYNDSRAPYS